MTEEHPLPVNGGTESELVRPTISFESVTFSSGTTLDFDEDEIVVFVGPNNAGKSAALREMEAFVSHGTAETVIKTAKLKKTGTQDDFRAYLLKHSQLVGDTVNRSYAGIGYNIHHKHVAYFDTQDNQHTVAGFFQTRLATENRITSSNPAGAISLHQDPPSHPIHLLLMDPKLSEKISGFFRHAFGKDLIPFRAGGGSFPLYVGEKPFPAVGEDELSKAFVEALLASAVRLEQQGDGMRSFAAVLLYVLAADNHSIQFLDEPEAFLHPPQARLIGEYIARERRAKSQLFLATHSTDVLDGLISGGGNKVRIIRIQRDGEVNRVKELSKEKTAAIANDTLLRYSGVFSGIFYEHVVICESDADCLFYSSILKTKAVSGDQRADVLFIHSAGKHRMANLAATLRELDVPVSVIADSDLLNDEGTFRNLVEQLGGVWDEFQGSWKAIKSSVETRRPPMNAEQVSKSVATELAKVEGIGQFPKTAELAIKRIFKSLSPWDDIKRAGRAGLPTGQTVKHWDTLTKKCAETSLWIVPVGELEGFCRSIDGRHGPGFVAKILEERILETDEELSEARKFVSAIWTAARNKTENKPSVPLMEQDNVLVVADGAG